MLTSFLLQTATNQRFENEESNGGSDESDDENAAVDFNEEELLRYYFSRGFKYEEIIQFLKKYYNHEISYSTLLRRLKQYGLKRRCQLENDIFIEARERISEIINGPG